MRAVTVTYAAEINKASDRFGVNQALLQSIIEVGGSPTNISGVSEDARSFAENYAAKTGDGNAANDGGFNFPEANIMAATWWLVRLMQTYNDQWTAVKAYFEMSPVGEGKMRRVFYVLYPKYEKLWRHES